MMPLTRNLLITAALLMSAPMVTAQYRDDARCSNYECQFNTRDTDRYSDSVYRPVGLSDFGSRIRDRYEHEWNRLRSGYDYRAPLDRAVDDSFRSPVSSDYGHTGRRLQESYDFDRRLPDPFQLPSTNRPYDSRRYRQMPDRYDLGSRDRYETRYRISFDRADDFDFDRSRNSLTDRYRYPDFDRDSDLDPRPARDSYDSDDRGLDPFVPPLPRRDGNSETEALQKAISQRYGNPINVRSVQSMSSNQALALYREVSQQTDQRHLEPSSYDLRVRRGLRNLALAMENQTFVQSLGVQADSFAVDGFRTTLSRIGESMRVNSYTDAQNVVQTVMRQADRVQGLTASVVAFEFANATVDTLDKFSALEPKEPGRGASLDLQKTEQVRSAGLESEIVGIGVEVKAHERGLLIMKALRGGPAAEARLQSGDIITAIDGRSISGMSMSNSVDLMTGSSGSRITLTVVRNESRGTNVTLVRRRVRIYTVNDLKMLPKTQRVAYMSLSQFGQKSTEELDQALNQMHNQGMKSLILDLRGNPGGLLNVCVDITNRFLPCGTIVSTKGRLSSDNMVETATYNRTWSVPLVVLVDGDSASASEIFAAAVQDNRRGIVVGQRSYGKGTVQTHFPLSTVNGNLRLTTARFYSPNGRPMSGAGVTPDVRIDDADGPVNGDRVLEEAIVIAQSQRLRDIAQAAKQCRPSAGGYLQKNSFKRDTFDAITPKTVLR